MKKITKQFLFCALSLSALTFVSCDDDDATGYSTLEVTEGVVGTTTLTAPLMASQTVNEPINAASETVYYYTITTNLPQSVDIHVGVKQIAGSATADEDYKFDNDIVIPAYATTATGSITILNDCLKEDTEDLTLQIGLANTSNATLAATTVSFVINNTLSDDLEFTFNFNQPFSISGTNYNLCAAGSSNYGYDMDFFVVNSADVVLPLYGAATGACAEHLVVDTSTLPDGEYDIVYDIYDDGGLAGVYHDPFDIPVTVDYVRCGAIDSAVFEQESQFVANSTDGSGSDYVIGFTILNGVVTITNSADQVLASGRNANKIKAAIAKAKLNLKK